VLEDLGAVELDVDTIGKMLLEVLKVVLLELGEELTTIGDVCL
jgi:hypothetical protein